ncbi:nucleoside 2-deoxyribosyltransferase [Dolosigranulum pigrum]|uniref:nucleoside 2-deoxyribosyltransferase n=1 Tax=Dolosigranulum pigrum TaxID=29394 RepID=UPI001AD87B21|nr:nucleoside 2-deoxyribosyltransferase [Dolosigranulum pigrum]QTJ49901.1 nucleoside 2-deoxyribosyltransferase [Dolosigranulum pigrum]
MSQLIYFAAPLFTEMEQRYNAYVVERIREQYGKAVDVYLPQENEAINDKSGFADSVTIAQGDNAYLEKADLIIAVLDGVTPDSGVSAEIGYFYGMKKPILGLYTDMRQGTHGNQAKIDALNEVAESQFSYINLYTVGLVKQRGKIVTSSDELMTELGTYLSSKPISKP